MKFISKFKLDSTILIKIRMFIKSTQQGKLNLTFCLLLLLDREKSGYDCKN